MERLYRPRGFTVLKSTVTPWYASLTMASFSESDRYQNRLDYCILRDGGVVLYRATEILADDVNWLTQEGYQLYSFDCQRWVSEQAMHSDWQAVLSFPSYDGCNFDALEDCLSDLVVPDVGGTVFVLRNFDPYAKGSGATVMHSGRTQAEVLLDILAGMSRYFLLTGKRVVVLVQTDDPTPHYTCLGGASAKWNPREWLNKNRGL
jgi:hypothetical protein